MYFLPSKRTFRGCFLLTETETSRWVSHWTSWQEIQADVPLRTASVQTEFTWHLGLAQWWAVEIWGVRMSCGVVDLLVELFFFFWYTGILRTQMTLALINHILLKSSLALQNWRSMSSGYRCWYAPVFGGHLILLYWCSWRCLRQTLVFLGKEIDPSLWTWHATVRFFRRLLQVFWRVCMWLGTKRWQESWGSMREPQWSGTETWVLTFWNFGKLLVAGKLVFFGGVHVYISYHDKSPVADIVWLPSLCRTIIYTAIKADNQQMENCRRFEEDKSCFNKCLRRTIL